MPLKEALWFIKMLLFHSARRRVTPTHTNNLGVPNGHTSFLSLSAQGAPSENEEEGSEGEIDDKFEWNWRDDSK